MSSLNCVQSAFSLFGECPSVLLWSVVMSYVDCGLMIERVELSTMSDCYCDMFSVVTVYLD